MRSKLQFFFSVTITLGMVLSNLASITYAWARPAIPIQPALSYESTKVNLAEPLLKPEKFLDTPATIRPSDQPELAEASLVGTAAVTPSAAIALTPIGRYETGVSEESAVEIVTHDPISQVVYISSAFSNTVEILDISDPTSPTLKGSLDMSPYGASVNSVDFYSSGSGVNNGLLAVAIEAEPIQDPGVIAVFNRAGTLVFSATVGALPDMVTFTPDGQKILTANEGEPNSDYTVDPDGSVSIIDVQSRLAQTASFTPFNTLPLDPNIRVFGASGGRTVFLPILAKDANLAPTAANSANSEVSANAAPPPGTVAQNLEPEYIALSPDSQTAYVTLQENNALAIVDIQAGTVLTVTALGFKDHNLPGNELDASDRDDTDDRDDQQVSGNTDVDGMINLQNWPILGMYLPDAIAAYEVGDQLYLVTANEGDARDYEAYSEEERVADVTLDPTAYPNAAVLQEDAKLGRLRITSANGDTDSDGDFDQLYAFGARSFSIWNGTTGALVYDSGSQFEQITAAFDPTTFNSQGGGDSFDERSDDKGPEPEGVDLGVINGRTYAFIVLERTGGMMVYDVTTPATPQFVQYVNTRYAYNDQSPEGVKFIPATESPTGQPMLAVAFEFSGSVTLFEISSTADGAGRLTLLHNNDGESTILPLTNTVQAGDVNYGNTESQSLAVAGVAAYKTVLDNNVAKARQAGQAVVNVYAGDAFLASAALQCSLPITATIPISDAVAQRVMNYDAHILGNHEFDYNPDFLERFIRDAKINGLLTQPFLSANLDFSGEPTYADLIDADGLLDGYSTDGRTVARSSIIVDEVTGQRFGIVSAITPDLPTISSPRDVQVTTANITATATLLQQEIDRLESKGVKKIILVSHLQNLATDRDQLVPLLSGVDIAVGGGGDEPLYNTVISATVPITKQHLPGETLNLAQIQTYPQTATDADGRTVYIVTTAGNYKYVGRLDVEFDANGEVAQIIQENSYPRRVILDSSPASALAALGVTDAVTPNENLQTTVVANVQNCLAGFAADVVATTDVLLDVSNTGSVGVRRFETNAGNMIADSFLYIHQKYAAPNGIPAPDNRTIAIQNGGGIRQNAGNFLPRSGVVPGPITVLDTYDVLAFTTNKITVVRNVSPADVKNIFERAASGLPGRAGQFLQVAGITVTYNISNTAQVIQPDGTVTTPGTRVITATLADGTPLIQGGIVVAGAPSITLTTNSFTAAGGDNYPWLRDNPNKTDLRDFSNVLISYDQAWREYMEDSVANGGLGGVINSAARPEYADKPDVNTPTGLRINMITN